MLERARIITAADPSREEEEGEARGGNPRGTRVDRQVLCHGSDSSKLSLLDRTVVCLDHSRFAAPEILVTTGPLRFYPP